MTVGVRVCVCMEEELRQQKRVKSARVRKKSVRLCVRMCAYERYTSTACRRLLIGVDSASQSWRRISSLPAYYWWIGRSTAARPACTCVMDVRQCVCVSDSPVYTPAVCVRATFLLGCTHTRTYAYAHEVLTNAA